MKESSLRRKIIMVFNCAVAKQILFFLFINTIIVKNQRDTKLCFSMAQRSVLKDASREILVFDDSENRTFEHFRQTKPLDSPESD